MTPAEFAKQMRTIARREPRDTEGAHAEADALMCGLLRELGFGEGVEIFTAMDKWYA